MSQPIPIRLGDDASSITRKKQKIELENLHREKKDEATANAKEISSLRLQVKELETQQVAKQAPLRETACPEERTTKEKLAQGSRDHLSLAVQQYLSVQGESFLKGLFDKFAEQCTGTTGDGLFEPTCPDDSSMSKSKPKFKFVRTNGLQAALLELGVPMKREKVEELMVVMDLDDNGGLDFEEFKRAVQQQPTQLEQWAGMLPLAGMLARSLPVSSGQGDQPLREFSRLSDAEINTTVEVFSEALTLLLITARASSKQMFDSMDKKAIEAAKDLADGVSAVSKYKTFKMSTGKVADYHNGLSSRIGAPDLNFSRGIQNEHCSMWGFNVKFTSSNYGLTTSPQKEYEISTGKEVCPEKDMMDKKGRRVRVIRPIAELSQLKLCQKAGLTDAEILAVVLYSGPMFQVYNTILRQFPARDFQQFQQGGNLFATTIFVLQSAIIKISRVMRLPPSLELYRGLGGLIELPDSFMTPDEHGCLGYLEYGFLSTTSYRETAVEYSGAGEGKPLPMVLQTRASSIDRGACIKELSQYPGEMEYLFPAGSYIEPSGPAFAVESEEGLLTMVPVRINANAKAHTVEEQLVLKKGMHVDSFRYLLGETERDLWRHADAEGAQSRLERDPSRVYRLNYWIEEGGRPEEWLLPGMSDGTMVTFTAAGLLARIMQQGDAVLKRHREEEPLERYTDAEAFRRLVTEMLEFRAAALDTLRRYLEDPGAQVECVMRGTVMAEHRGYLAFLERNLPEEGEGRAEAAARLCRAMGAMLSSESVNEEDAEGLTPLMRAAANGAEGRVLRYLVAARADVDRREGAPGLGRTALCLAASCGRAEAVEALAALGADVNATAEDDEKTPAFIAAREGHIAVIEALGRLGADVNRAASDRRTPVYIAARFGHTAAIEALVSFSADVSQATRYSWTPLGVAASNGKAAAVETLVRLRADVNQVAGDGLTALAIATGKGHHGVAVALRRLGAAS